MPTSFKISPVLNKLDTIIPLTFLVISGIIFVPATGLSISIECAVYVHFISFMVLGVFFEIPEVCLNIWSLLKAGDRKWLSNNGALFKKIIMLRYVLTHWVAPSAGIMTITSGLYLILLGKDSLTQGWLFWLLCTSTIGLYKGVIQHRFYIKQILYVLQDQKKITNLGYYVRSPFDNICIFSECPTYLFNYWLACSKPQWLANPWWPQVLYLEQLFHSRVFVGILMVGWGGFLIFPIRFLIKKYSRVYSL